MENSNPWSCRSQNPGDRLMGFSTLSHRELGFRIPSSSLSAFGFQSLSSPHPFCWKLNNDRDDGDDNEGVLPFVVKFNHRQNGNQNLLGVSDEKGRVSILDTGKEEARAWTTTTTQAPHKDTSLYSASLVSWSAHENAIFDFIWNEEDHSMVTAAGDQLTILWDIETQVPKAIMSGHTMSVKCVRQMPQSPAIFATSSRDGNVFIYDCRQPPSALVQLQVEDQTRARQQPSVPIHSSITNAFDHIHTNETRSNNGHKRKRTSKTFSAHRSVTALEFTANGHELITAGAIDGMVKLWDLRTTTSAKVKKSKSNERIHPIRTYAHCSNLGRQYGISSLALDSNRRKLVVNAHNSKIYQYDIYNPSSEPTAVYQGHQNSSFYVKSVLCPQDNFIASGSGDGNIYIWKVDEPGWPKFQLKEGHGGEVCSVMWCPGDSTKLASCADDQTVRLWTTSGLSIDDLQPNTTERAGRCVSYSVPPKSSCPSASSRTLGRVAPLPQFVE